MRGILKRLNIGSKSGQRNPHGPKQAFSAGDPRDLTEEERSQVELVRLQHVIEERKQIARDTDISYHLWGFYTGHIRDSSPGISHGHQQDRSWYDVRILQVSTKNGLNQFEFELKGARYRFVDDEENQGWCENIKYFSLFLYDDSDRCLIEIPMKLRVDSQGRNYSVLSDGPRAFLTGGWVNDFIHVKLKHQSIRKQEIRAQKHRERLWEIEDLKDKFGISD